MKIREKIHTSFTWQLTLWVTGFVLVISGVVIFLLARFSQDSIHQESLDTTQQALENTALRVNNMLTQAEMTARLEHQSLRVTRGRIERLVAENGFENTIRQSLPHAELFVSRRDRLGRLTNSFILMQQSLATMVNDIRCVNEELEQHNDELASATQLKQETNRRKADFIHYMYHEIRTPLNIISGFAQVLTASRHSLESDEVEDIMARMQESANDIRRLTRQLEQTANQQQVIT